MDLSLIAMPLSPLLQILLLLAIIILASKAAGALSKRLGQPAVLGELLVGLVLGPTAMNLLHWAPFQPAAGDAAMQHFLPNLIKYMAELGVIFLMFLAGLETDLKEMRRVGLASFMGASGGVVLPLLAGFAIAKYVGGFGDYESLYIGVILTATSVSISAQTLLEMGHLRSREGVTILGAAVIDDVMGIILLSVVIALHGGDGPGTEPIWWILTKMVLYFAIAIGLGTFIPKLLRWAARMPGTETGFAMAVVLALLYAFSAEAVGKVAAITGSYLIGVIIAQQHDLGHKVVEKLSVLAYGFFVPIFFVNIGLEAPVTVALLRDPVTVSLIVAAIVTKVVGSGLGVKLVGFSLPESIRVGIGMISRGEVALIVAGIGLTAGVIDQKIFSIMVVMTLATTLVTPILLRLVFPALTHKPKEF